MNINAMFDRETDNPALDRYARVSEVLAQRRFKSRDQALEQLVQLLRQWTEDLMLQGLSGYGLKHEDIDHVVAHSRGSSMKTNPIVLTDDEIKAILVERM